MNRKAWLVAAAFLMTGAAQATCYSIYKADGKLLQQSSTSPVDLSQQIGDTVPEKFGRGATMTVSDQGIYCQDKRERAQAGAKKTLADSLVQEEKKAQAEEKKAAAPAEATKTAAN
jgi:hypothetical protein